MQEEETHASTGENMQTPHRLEPWHMSNYLLRTVRQMCYILIHRAADLNHNYSKYSICMKSTSRPYIQTNQMKNGHWFEKRRQTTCGCFTMTTGLLTMPSASAIPGQEAHRRLDQPRYSPDLASSFPSSRSSLGDAMNNTKLSRWPW